MRKWFIVFAAGVLVSCVSCVEKKNVPSSIEGFALGTVYQITVVDNAPDNLRERVEAVFAVADSTMSIFNENSLLSRVNRNETDILNNDIIYNIALARGVSEMSGGRYDITIQPLVEAYGFINKGQAERINIDSVLQYVGYNKISVKDGKLIKQHPETKLDLNSIAKGYTVDMVAKMLDKEGCENYMVNIGGEIYCKGLNAKGSKWRIAIDTPFEGNITQGAYTSGVLEISGVGIATSGNYRNYHTGKDGKKYTHIINPLTGENTDGDLLSATVIAESCAKADAMGTMFITLGMSDAMKLLDKHPEIATMLIFTDSGGAIQRYVSPAMKKYIPTQTH